MTNRNMVGQPRAGQPATMPEPNLAPPRPVPAPESDPPGTTLGDPLDSPQPKPMINEQKSGHLKARREAR